MTELSAAAVLGQGYYNRHSDLQRGIASLGLPWLTQAAREAALPAHGLIFVADYGCATRANSLAPMDLGVQALRGRSPQHRLPDPNPALHPQEGERLAAAYVDYLRAAIEPTLATALSPERPHRERHHLLQDFFTRFQRHVSEDPLDVHADRQVAVAWLSRR